MWSQSIHRFSDVHLRQHTRLVLVLLMAAGGLPVSVRANEPMEQDPGATPLVGMTRPFREAVLGTVFQGRIQQFFVEEGGFVHADDPISELDNAVQQTRVRIAQAEAESSLQVDLTQTRFDHAQREYDRLSRLYGDASASSKELTDADAALRMRRLEFEIAKFDLQVARLQLEREKRTLEQFTIRAPFSGYVLERLKQVGESVDLDEGVVRMAQLDPLLVVVDCPLDRRSGFTVGDAVRVEPLSPEYGKRTGVVRFVSPVADGGSQTFRVKIAVENPEGAWIAGMKVEIHADHHIPESKRVNAP